MFIWISGMVMIFVPSVNVRACVSLPFRLRDVDSRYGKYIIYVDDQTKAPAISECKMRLPHVCRLRSPKFGYPEGQVALWGLLTERERIVPLRFSDILESCPREKDEQTARTDVWLSLILSHEKTPNQLSYAEVCYLLSQTCSEVTKSILFV